MFAQVPALSAAAGVSHTRGTHHYSVGINASIFNTQSGIGMTTRVANPGAIQADMGLHALKIDRDEKHPLSNYFPMPALISTSRSCLAFWATWYPIRLRSTCPSGPSHWER